MTALPLTAPRLEPCAGCTHARDHHVGCRVHEGCCGADDCGCMGFEPGDADVWDTVIAWDDRPATRAEIERAAAFVDADPDELERAVRQVEAEAATPRT